MLIEIKKKNGDLVIVNSSKILLCYEYRGKITIELEDGTPIDTAYTLDELRDIFHSFGEAFAIQEQRK